MTTDEQIIAAAGKPVAIQLFCETCDGLGYIDERLGGFSFSDPRAACPDCHGKRFVEASSYTADAILAAAKPLKEEIERLKTVPMKYRRMTFNAQLQDENAKLLERIAELEAEVERLKVERDQAWSINPTTSEQLLRQQNAELTKRRDGLLVALKDAVETIKWMHGCTAPAYDEVKKAIHEGNTAIASVKDI